MINEKGLHFALIVFHFNHPQVLLASMQLYQKHTYYRLICRLPKNKHFFGINLHRIVYTFRH